MRDTICPGHRVRFVSRLFRLGGTLHESLTLVAFAADTVDGVNVFLLLNELVIWFSLLLARDASKGNKKHTLAYSLLASWNSLDIVGG